MTERCEWLKESGIYVKALQDGAVRNASGLEKIFRSIARFAAPDDVGSCGVDNTATVSHASPAKIPVQVAFATPAPTPKDGYLRISGYNK